MNMITRIAPDAGTPSRNLANEETQADHNGLDELIVLRMSELRVTNRSAIDGQLSASIAHEINQPLAAIALSGSAALRWLSLKNPDFNEVRSCLECMVADSHRAAKVVDAVRAMYKRDVQSKSMVDLSELVAETLDMLRTEIVKHDVKVRKVETEMLPRVFADRVQLQQVLINLIKNAIDAMSSVNNRSRILQIQTELNDGEIITSVEDSGVGLAPGDADNIFAAFFTTKPQGMGIGLSICRSIIEMHGGRLWVARGSPRGAVFQFTLPTANPSASLN
jgi:C4-dicarboxylate-specific signal transduction histidine kinase